MNWFVVGSVALYFGAAGNSWVHGNRALAGMWFCYALANMCMAYAEYKIRTG